MAGQNRTTYARAGGASNHGMVALFRGAFYLLVALTLSFGLGFFVIARMVPSTGGEASSGPGGSANGASGGAANGRKSARDSESNSAVHASVGRAAAQKHDGPEILPETSVQKPDKLESDTPGTNSDSSNGNADAGNGDSGTKASDGDAAHVSRSANGPANSESPAETSGLRRAPRHQTGDLQPAASPDAAADRTAAPGTQDGGQLRGAERAAPVKNGLYRVQLGVFSTREKAEEVARDAADKGITSTVRAITRDGRTLYRVQHSAHSDRTRAEQDRQKIIDAGLDASIINPS